MDIYLLRHGKAERNVKSDAKRKLTVTGKKEIVKIGRAINSLGIVLDTVATSPLARAYQTAEIVLDHIAPNVIIPWDELKPESDVFDTVQRLAKLKMDTAILLVGHQPHLSNLISYLIGGSTNIALKKGGLGHIRISGGLQNGILRSLMTPKQLQRLAK